MGKNLYSRVSSKEAKISTRLFDPNRSQEKEQQR